jgi:hypothetical protein
LLKIGTGPKTDVEVVLDDKRRVGGIYLRVSEPDKKKLASPVRSDI